ncbi:MAG: PIN domain-containing protein [Candidatus Aenigmatarchaeota archaeon]
MLKIIFDTNFLIDLFRFKILLDEIEEIFNEKVEFFTLNKVLEELKRMSQSKGKKGNYAKLALILLKEKNVKILDMRNKNTDDALINFAKKNYVIATNDKELRKKLKELNFKIIYLRGKKKIMMG